jgi:hypothetical protein
MDKRTPEELTADMLALSARRDELEGKIEDNEKDLSHLRNQLCDVGNRLRETWKALEAKLKPNA